MEWLDVDNIQYTVRISDTDVQIPDDDDPELVIMKAGGTPMVISSVNNSKDKFYVIRGKKVELQFRPRLGLDITTFANGADSRFAVEVEVTDLIDTYTLFTGFLVLDDCHQLSLPICGLTTTLVASDHLAMLRDIPLTDDDGNTPGGYDRIMEYVALCLKKTGLALNINVVNNLRHGTGSLSTATTFSQPGNYFVTDGLLTEFFYVGQKLQITDTTNNNRTAVVTDVTQNIITQVTLDDTIATSESVTATFTDLSTDHIYDSIYINAKSGEKDINESEDCATWLEKILGNDCFITQYRGEWWIMRVDEYDENIMYNYVFDSDGVFSNTFLTSYYLKDIGSTEDIKFVFADLDMSIPRPHDHTKLSFAFDPITVPENSEFDQGDVLDDSSETEKTYTLDKWDLYKDFPSATPVGNTAFIRREFNDLGDESERYAVISIGSTDSIYYILSHEFPVHAGDRIGFSVDIKWNGQVETSPGFLRRNVAMVRLYADDGTYYSLFGGTSADNDSEWVATNATFTTDRKYIHLEMDGSDDDTVWHTATFYIDANSPDIPKDGVIKISLHSEGKADEFETHFGNLRVEYIPNINGSFRKYSGQYYKVEREEDGYFAKKEDEVGIADAPKRLFKGAMHFPQSEVAIYTGNARFVDDRSIILEDGDVTLDFEDNTIIRVSGTLFNEQLFKVQSKSYTIIGDETVLTVPRGVTTEASVSVVIYKQIFALTSRWYTSHVFATGSPPSMDHVKPYGKQQIDAVWNQNRNHIRVFEGHLKGLGIDWPDLIHKYRFTDSHTNYNDRYFILLSYEQDFKSAIWRGVFAEVYRTDGKVYDDPGEFKYIAE